MMQNWEQNQEQSKEDDDEVSRSQCKRDAEALQDIGERLIRLNNTQLSQLDIPEKLMDAVREAKRLTANGAIRRQKQYIGKLMRNTDPAPILEKFAEWDGSSREQAAKSARTLARQAARRQGHQCPGACSSNAERRLRTGPQRAQDSRQPSQKVAANCS
jgi:ribosomal 50S subunit-associated protein YjgA (DUF615 family)